QLMACCFSHYGRHVVAVDELLQPRHGTDSQDRVAAPLDAVEIEVLQVHDLHTSDVRLPGSGTHRHEARIEPGATTHDHCPVMLEKRQCLLERPRSSIPPNTRHTVETMLSGLAGIGSKATSQSRPSRLRP